MASKTQPLIDAIVEQFDESDDRRAQRFLDDLRQEGVLPGRRGRFVHRLRRTALTLRGWVDPLVDFWRDLTTGRQPASYWLELMDQLVADGRSPEDAAREVTRQMESEDHWQGLRWFAWIGILMVITIWILLIFVAEKI